MIKVQLKKIARQIVAKRIHLLVAGHVLIFIASYDVAMRLRFDLDVPLQARSQFWTTIGWMLGVKLLTFYWFGSFHGWWRYITFSDLAVILRASTISSAAIALVDYFAIGAYQIPRSVLIMDWAATIFLLGGLRSASRLLREHIWPALGPDNRHRALLIGVRKAGEAVVQQIHSSPSLEYRIVGLLDDDRRVHGTRLGGIPFLGKTRDAVRLAAESLATEILVVANSIPARELRALMEQSLVAHIQLRIVPTMDNLLDGNSVLQVRSVDINDLLRRDPVNLEGDRIEAMLRGKTVLVTGAGGSIGSEICRQVLCCEPKTVLLVEQAENGLFHLDRELQASRKGTAIVPLVADIRDYDRLHQIFAQWQPEIIFHAAAHKHVPLMEVNPGEAINNNVFGTKQLADIAHKFGVDRVVMISTDKAVNPTSIMGVSKLLAEKYVHAFVHHSKTKFMVVRFGNVLASAGSVIPIFQEQIRRGGPITVTHPEMRRYFMTIPEASQLVLQAASMGKGGEIFVLDMGSPVRITDLARDLIRLSGFSSADIDIEFTGIRPGEKLYEELYLDHEATKPTSHPKVWMANATPLTDEEVELMMRSLSRLIGERDDVIRAKLRKLVPDYVPFETAESNVAVDEKAVNGNDGNGIAVDEKAVDGKAVEGKEANDKRGQVEYAVAAASEYEDESET